MTVVSSELPRSRRPLRCWLPCAAFLVAGQALAQPPQEAVDPGSARLITSDIERFWDVIDRSTDATMAGLLQRDYLDAGSQGLRDFIPYRILSADSLAARIRRDRARYEAARANSLRMSRLEREIRAAFYAFAHLYPDAVFPDVYFVIGRFNSGGTTSPRGLLIGAEMQADLADVPRLVAHELAHFQQGRIGRYSLLSQTIREGSADFIAELVTGRRPSGEYFGYGLAYERSLWREFQTVMRGTDLSGWMYGGQAPDRPPDLAYFLGYRIAEAYYLRAANRRDAIRDILMVTDYAEFLMSSGYDP